MLRSIIELTLAINCLLLAINLRNANMRITNLEHRLWYLELKDMMKGDEKNEIRRNKK